MLSTQQEQIIEAMERDGSLSYWHDWHWHLRNGIKDIDTFERLSGIELDPQTREDFARTVQKFPMSITPYYLSLIDVNDYANDPVFRQAFPSPLELVISRTDMADPLHEDKDSPAPCITHRYPDRVLFQVTGVCSMYCRHCTRKRRVGNQDMIPTKEELLAGIAYVRKTPQVRDVLLSGGDPLMLSDERLDWLLGELRGIDHVEVIRIGTRMPVVLPYRITDDLVAMLKKHHPLWLNTHFNHPREVTYSAKQALAKLANAGIPLGNQSVLLAGVNDCPRIMRALVHKLVSSRVRPYYLYQCDLSEGLSHFRTPVGKGIEILESLIGHTSGFCVPTYVIDAPGGGGKIPLLPDYVHGRDGDDLILKNFEGKTYRYTDPEGTVGADRTASAENL